MTPYGQLFKADISVVDSGQEKTYTIDFVVEPGDDNWRADNAYLQAAGLCFLWYENRREAWINAGGFGKLVCVKLYRLYPQQIQPDGYLGSATSFPCYEWKCDGGKRRADLVWPV